MVHWGQKIVRTPHNCAKCCQIMCCFVVKYVGFTNNRQQKPLFIWMFWSGRSPWKLSVSKLYLKVKFSFKKLFAVWFTKGWLHRWIPKIDIYKFCGIYHVSADAHMCWKNIRLFLKSFSYNGPTNLRKFRWLVGWGEGGVSTFRDTQIYPHFDNLS